MWFNNDRSNKYINKVHSGAAVQYSSSAGAFLFIVLCDSNQLLLCCCYSII